MQIDIGPPHDDDELRAFVPIHRRTYLMSPEDGEEWAGWVPRENMRLARIDGQPVGGMHLVPMGQYFGGRSVPMTGISAVGIEPQARATGVGTTFMATVLNELHEQGVAISSLYPATEVIYRRCGYELAGSHIRYEIRMDDIDVRDRDLDVSYDDDPDTIKAIYATWAARSNGPLDRNDLIWKRTFEPWKDEYQYYVIRDGTEPVGYVVYGQKHGDAPASNRMYGACVTLTPAATRRALTFLADHRSFVNFWNWNGPPADPFSLPLGEPRRKVTMSWPWMLRVVDVATALRERGYWSNLEAELHLRVHDDVLAGNDGAWTLRVSGGKGVVERGGSGDLDIDVRGLAALYTGFHSPQELVSCGYLRGTDDSLAVAGSLFAGPAPFLPDFF